LIMTLLVSDEADLVEANLDYHLARGVDFVIITANRVSDEISEKLQRYVELGVARVITEAAHTYAQSAWVTRMARMATEEHAADWVLNCDPDEFYWPNAGSLKDVFASIPDQYGSLVIPAFHFVPRPCEHGFFADRLTVREVRSLKPGGRHLFVKVAHRATPEVEVARGNHKVCGPGLESAPAWWPITGLHFPLRSYSQFERKVIKDGQAVANNPDPKVSFGIWRELYEIYKTGQLPAFYANKVLDTEEIRAQIRAGRLVVDERLKTFFKWYRKPEHRIPTEVDPDRVESLRIAMNRSIYEMELSPLSLEVANLTNTVEVLKERVEKYQARIEKLKRARTENLARIEKLKRARADHRVRIEKLKRARARLTRRIPDESQPKADLLQIFARFSPAAIRRRRPAPENGGGRQK
jgi:hypothetical protein